MKVSEVIPVSGMLGEAPNAAEMLGGAATVSDAVPRLFPVLKPIVQRKLVDEVKL